MKRYASAVVCAALFIAGCATAPTPQPLREKSPSSARVVIIDRARGVLAPLTYRVLIDGAKACNLRGGEYAVVDLAPGVHRFGLEDEAGAAPADFTVTAARDTYLEISVPAKEAARFVEMNPDDARPVILSARRVETLLPQM